MLAMDETTKKYLTGFEPSVLRPSDLSVQDTISVARPESTLNLTANYKVVISLQKEFH
jgi:hypothetical protein